MGKLPILPKIMNHSASRQSYLSNNSLPTDYMSDYSVLGLTVSSLQEATRILEENNFAVIKRSAGAEVTFDNTGHVQEIIRTLNRHGVDCGITDIVDQVYQG
jgi:hypothetical protein